MEEDWIFLGDGASGRSDTDSASDDDDSGFTIVRRGRKGGDHCSVVVSDDAPAQPRVATVAVPQPTPPGLSFRVVSYGEASSDGGGRREHPGCNDEATAGEASQGADIDDAAATGSTDCGVTCKEGCESDGSTQVGNHDGTGSSVEAPLVAVEAAPTVNCLEATAVLHGEVHPELASGMMGQGGAEEVEDDDSERCEGEEDEHTENFDDEEEYTAEISSEEEYTVEICSEEEEVDAESCGEEESSHVVDVADIFGMLLPRATTACDANAEQGAANANGAVKEPSESFHDDIDNDSSDTEDDIADVAENGNQNIFDMLLPRERTIDDQEEAATATVDIFRMLFPGARACDDDVDGTCDVPGTSAQSGPAEALFTVRGRERALAIEEVRRREDAQQELDRALARQAAAAAEALEWDVLGCPTAKRQATGVTQPAVAELDASADFTFIIGVYVFVYLAVSLFFSSVVR